VSLGATGDNNSSSMAKAKQSSQSGKTADSMGTVRPHLNIRKAA
jgi:hypothetical protein